MDGERRCVRRRAWSLALVVAVAAVGLAACNPLDKEVGAGAMTSYTYTGPIDGGIQVYLSGYEGYRVEFKTGMLWAGGPTRLCGNGITGAPEACYNAGDYLGPYDWHDPVNDPPETWWPMMVLHSGESVRLFVRCYQGDAWVTCPATLKAHARTVDADRNLVGDLT